MTDLYPHSYVWHQDLSTSNLPPTSPVDPVPKLSSSNKPTHVPRGSSRQRLPSRALFSHSEVPMLPVSGFYKRLFYKQKLIRTIVMANYLIAISGHEGTNWQIKGTALACYTLATLSRTMTSSLFHFLEINEKQLLYSTRSMPIGSPMPSASSRSAPCFSSSSPALSCWAVAPESRIPRPTSVMRGLVARLPLHMA